MPATQGRAADVTDRRLSQHKRKDRENMLVLSRKRYEKIRVAKDIEIVIVEIRDDKVRVGIHAPPGVSIHREEVFQAIYRNGGSVPCIDNQLPQTTSISNSDEQDGKSSQASEEPNTEGSRED